jgi:hypothetical protein
MGGGSSWRTAPPARGIAPFRLEVPGKVRLSVRRGDDDSETPRIRPWPPREA